MGVWMGRGTSAYRQQPLAFHWKSVASQPPASGYPRLERASGQSDLTAREECTWLQPAAVGRAHPHKRMDAAYVEALCQPMLSTPVLNQHAGLTEGKPQLEAAPLPAGLPIHYRSECAGGPIKCPAFNCCGRSHGQKTTSTLSHARGRHGARPHRRASVGWFRPQRQRAGGQATAVWLRSRTKSDGSLVQVQPSLGCITNWKLDHTDHTPTSKPYQT